MTATGHALVGAAIGAQIANPIVSLPLALISHFLGDKLPHWDVMTEKGKSWPRLLGESAVDVVVGFMAVGLIFLWWLRVPNPAEVLVAAFFAQLPDWLEAPYVLFKMRSPLTYYNYRFQKWIHDLWFDSRLSAPWGIITQAATVILFIFWAITTNPALVAAVRLP